MKKPMTKWYRWRVFWAWMRKHTKGVGLICTCSMCNSTRVTRTSSSTRTVANKDVSYHAEYQCHDCGAIAHAEEYWTK